MASVSREGLLNWLFAPWYFFVIIKEIIRFKPDIGFITDETANAFWGVICKILKIPYISYCSVPVFNRDDKYSNYKMLNLFFQAVFKLIKRRILQSYERSRTIIAVSNSTKEQIIKSMPDSKNKIDVIPRSINDIFFERPMNKDQISTKKRELNINENHFVFLSVSRLTPNKGIDDVIKAINNMKMNKRGRIRYIVLGSGRYIKNLKKMSSQLELEENILFHDEVDHLELIIFYDMCDIFVLPSRRGISESFGRVFAEAAARCKASIGVNEGGMRDIIENQQTGFLIDAGDINALEKIFEYSLENKEQIKMMGLRAKLKAEKQYNSYINAKKYEKHLQEIVRRCA
jgi:glycosyltransferase involved in cell wall biosynthesis